MRNIKFEPLYKRNYKALKKDHFPVEKLKVVADKIRKGESLAEYHDHALKGDKHGTRELHVDKKQQSNWLLLYKIDLKSNAVIFYKTGSHDDVLGKGY